MANVSNQWRRRVLRYWRSNVLLFIGQAVNVFGAMHCHVSRSGFSFEWLAVPLFAVGIGCVFASVHVFHEFEEHQ